MARKFNGGTNYISLGSVTGLQNISAFTICCWVYRAAAGNITIPFTWGIDGTANLNGLGLYWWSDNHIYYDNKVNNASQSRYTGILTNTGWHHLAAVHDPGNFFYAIYLNGVAQSLTGSPNSSTYQFTGCNAYCGRVAYANTYVQSTNDMVAYLQIFNAALSIDLVKNTMYTPWKTSALSSCLRSYPFDGYSGEVDEAQGGQTINVGSGTNAVIFSDGNGPPTWK